LDQLQAGAAAGLTRIDRLTAGAAPDG